MGHRPHHRPAEFVGHGDNSIVRNINPLIFDADSIVTAVRFPVSIRMKVSEKGGVSVYGIGRFPVTLYKEQWLKLLNMSEEIRAFIAENEARLKAHGPARIFRGYCETSVTTLETGRELTVGSLISLSSC